MSSGKNTRADNAREWKEFAAGRYTGDDLPDKDINMYNYSYQKNRLESSRKIKEKKLSLS